MNFLSKRAFKLLFLPGGAIIIGAVLFVNAGWVPVAASAINFFYYTVFIAAVALAWRFHATRMLFGSLVLLLGHRALEFFAQGRMAASGPGRAAFIAVAFLIPLDFALLPLFPERGTEGRSLVWFIVLLFFESVFVTLAARPEHPPPAFLDFAFLRSYDSPLPQPALLIFIGALAWLLIRVLKAAKPTVSGMFWSLAAAGLGLNAGGVGKTGSFYFGAAALILASSIIENSYSLAYQDELTGLNSRRAFNDRLLRLKPPYTVAAVDIDRFKSINDTYGHETGDQVLRLVASRLARVGGGGEPFRVGGEEFTILFPGRNLKAVLDYLELLRLQIENSSFRLRSGEERRRQPRGSDRRRLARKRPVQGGRVRSGLRLSVTVSIGVAESHSRLRVEEVLELADQALYRAKQRGRNRIEATLVQAKKTKRGKSAEP
jgi:diguanylate cyclase (GGDEF)-like protein